MEPIDISTLGSISEMMEEEMSWGIVSKSLDDSNDEYEQESKLVDTLSKLTPKEMIGFRLRTDKLLYYTIPTTLKCGVQVTL